MPAVNASAGESEYGALFINGQVAEGIRNNAADLGHPQPPTTMVTDSQCAHGIANDTVKQKRSKAIDMRYHWVRDRVRQKHFRVLWKPGKLNRADFFTKNHPVHHHRSERRHYVSDGPAAPPKTPAG
jgi:hypothetical protein